MTGDRRKKHVDVDKPRGYGKLKHRRDVRLAIKDQTSHEWEVVRMYSGARAVRCKLCWYAYEFGFDLPCPVAAAAKKEARRAG